MFNLNSVVKKRYSFLSLGTSTLHYSYLAGGTRVLLTFHGFGQSKKDLEELEKALAPTYTIYSFDLFYHGDSQGNGPERPITKDDWKEWLQPFFAKENIRHYAVLGFSIGGRFALATIEAFPENAKELLLIAPDGIKPNFWYALATSPGLPQKIFRKVVYHPDTFRALAAWGRTLRLAHPKLIRLVQRQLNSSEKQELLYRSWINFKPLSFAIASLAALLNARQIPTRIFLGKYDLILQEKDVKPLTRRLENCRVILLESGHTHLLNHVARYFLSQMPAQKTLDSG
jgi:pimeloyl-ACP methyl ester carboxylesterase